MRCRPNGILKRLGIIFLDGRLACEPLSIDPHSTPAARVFHQNALGRAHRQQRRRKSLRIPCVRCRLVVAVFNKESNMKGRECHQRIPGVVRGGTALCWRPQRKHAKRGVEIVASHCDSSSFDLIFLGQLKPRQKRHSIRPPPGQLPTVSRAVIRILFRSVRFKQPEGPYADTATATMAGRTNVSPT